MTGKQLESAMRTLGKMWGLDRPVQMTELGRLLQIENARPNETVAGWLRRGPPGPAATAVEALLSGWRPKYFARVIADGQTSGDCGK